MNDYQVRRTVLEMVQNGNTDRAEAAWNDNQTRLDDFR